VKIIEGLDAGLGGFEEEVRLLSKCRHPNVVMLLGFSREDAASAGASRRALVYELLPGGDVEDRLLRNKGPPFLWRDRLRTSIDMARGLAHLHKHRPEIFHRDIKPPNVLFGADGAARIADFGLACISKKHGARELSVDVAAGTPGYADPLYAKTGIVTEASEVYSMGMVLIQLLTCRPPALVDARGSVWFLINEICPEHAGAKNRILHIVDAQARWPKTVSTTIASLALLCIHADVDQRPSFMDLAAVLQDLLDVDATMKSHAIQAVSSTLPVATPDLLRAGSFSQAAHEPVIRAGSFAQAHMMQASPRPIRTPSFAEAAGQDVMHRPLHNSRIVRGASFGDGSIMQVSGQSAYASHGIPGYGASIAAAACRSPQGARCAEVYRVPQPALPVQHGMSMYVQR
jgi:serine/threonine protein kinase